MKCSRAFCLAFVLLAVPAVTLAQASKPEDRAEDHAMLRALLAKGAEALNSRNFDAIAPSLDPNFTIITVDNQKHVGLDAFKKYYASLFDGPSAIFSKIEARVTADDLTHFVDPSTGITYGTSEETYHFKDGDVRTMRTRWSAVSKKEGGAWKLVTVHFSTNVLDNPVLDAAKSLTKKIAAAAAVIGLVVGVLLMFLLRRRPST